MARRNHNSRRNDSAPGWVWMLFGLGLGLIVAVGVYLRSPPQPTPSAPSAARSAAPPPAERQRAAAPSQPAGTTAAENRFDFYEILPQFEVEVPAPDSRTTPSVRTRPVDQPGRYLLQAGSFGAAADADRLQASLALRGIESHVQRVTIDNAVFHRVRIGPISDLDALNRTRQQLRDAGIDPLLMKAPQ